MKKNITFIIPIILIAFCPSISQPFLSKPEILAGNILIYPDINQSNLIYYVPSRLSLIQTYGQPQFFFYKYIYVKQKAEGAPQTIAGGILTLGIEFADDSEALRQLKGETLIYRPVSIEKINCQLNYESLESFEEKGEEQERKTLGKRELLWTRKNFTLPLSRASAQFLWQIFQENKATGLTIECEFEYKGYELDSEGKLVEGIRRARISFPVPVTFKDNPNLFKVINLSEKINFNYRNLSILCFDFVNRLNDSIAKIMVEIEIITARRQRDLKTVYFSADSDPQVDLDFKIPEPKGAKYRYRITRIFIDGKAERGEWLDGDEMFLDISTYEISEKEGIK